MQRPASVGRVIIDECFEWAKFLTSLTRPITNINRINEKLLRITLIAETSRLYRWHLHLKLETAGISSEQCGLLKHLIAVLNMVLTRSITGSY